MDWHRNCGNCEYAVVCDYENNHAFCSNWYGWVPVDAICPEVNKRVFLLDDTGDIHIGQFAEDQKPFGSDVNGKFFWVDGKTNAEHNIIYWKPFGNVQV